MATTTALLGLGRLNNFRLNGLDPALVKTRAARVGILLNGKDVRGRVRRESVTIRDAINDAPNSATLTIEGLEVSPYAEAVLADQPIAYWRLGDYGTSAADASGHGHTGTVLGAVTVNQPGGISDGDRAMRFPGVVGARVEVAASSAFALTDGVTVEAWVKTDLASQNGGIVDKTIGGAAFTSYSLMQAGGSWLFLVAGSFGLAQITAPVAPEDVGQWVHLVAGWHSAPHAIWLYKNGVVAGSSSVPEGPLTAGAGVLLMGGLGSGIDPFAGTIDEVAIYLFLNEQRIAAHAAAGRAVSAPAIAQDLRITIGIDNPVLLFNGAISQVDLTYQGREHRPIYRCSATDDTARANRRRPFGQWTSVSATVVAQQLIAQFVPGFGSAFVQPGLPPVTVFFDGSEGMNRCLTQITNLIGGYWYFQDKQLHLFISEPSASPDPIDESARRFLEDPHIASAVEMSQVRTRVYGRGHGEALLGNVLPADGLLPIADAVMFSPTGGQAIAGSQILRYTGRELGGAGSLVGPGAAPAVGPTATLATGAGLASGRYGYAYTNVTPTGESLIGPTTVIDVGVSPAPPTAPTVGPPTMGPGPDPGAHAYAVSFVTPSGETVIGPQAGGTTGLSNDPTSAPTVSNVSVGTGPDPGAHAYAVSFVTAIGETLVGPQVQVTTGYESRHVVPPTFAPLCTLGDRGASNNLLVAAGYPLNCAVSFRTEAGETTVGPTGSVAVPGSPPATVSCSLEIANIPIGPPGTISRLLYWWSSYSGGGVTNVYLVSVPDNTTTVRGIGKGDGDLGHLFSSSGQVGPKVNTAGDYLVDARQVALSNLPRGEATVTARKIYRTAANASALLFVATIPNNTATSYTDTTTDAGLGAAAPSVSTAYLQQFKLTAIPLGDALVTARKIYRTAANGSTFLLAATLADNTTTTWVDTVPDAALGAVAPAVNTATANQVALSAIAVGASIVTSRKIYRTAHDAPGLQYLATIPNNSTLTYLDSAPDATLGAAPPSADNSGLTQPQGQVNAGSSSLITASAAPFRAAGGWAVIGSQTIRYAGISGNVLTGIPATGPGAIAATVRYGDHILAAPMLTGVTVPGGLTQPAGTVVYIWVQRDDLAAQAAMRAYDGGDGIYEYLAQDERRGEASLTAICDAHLLAYKSPLQTITYATRDLKTKSGKPILVDLVKPPISGSLVIQDVSIDQIEVAPGLMPRFTVVASSTRFSFEDLVRQLAGTLEA